MWLQIIIRLQVYHNAEHRYQCYGLSLPENLELPWVAWWWEQCTVPIPMALVLYGGVISCINIMNIFMSYRWLLINVITFASHSYSKELGEVYLVFHPPTLLPLLGSLQVEVLEKLLEELSPDLQNNLALLKLSSGLQALGRAVAMLTPGGWGENMGMAVPSPELEPRASMARICYHGPPLSLTSWEEDAEPQPIPSRAGWGREEPGSLKGSRGSGGWHLLLPFCDGPAHWRQYLGSFSYHHDIVCLTHWYIGALMVRQRQRWNEGVTMRDQEEKECEVRTRERNRAGGIWDESRKALF